MQSIAEKNLGFDITIIGYGFSGILLSYHLTRLAPELKIAVISPKENIGGLAYRKATANAVLNVPHWRMSALTSEPDNFSKFVSANNCHLQDDAFARRQDYNLYLQTFVQRNLEAGVTLIDATATGILKNNNFWEIKTSHGTINSRQVALALGNLPPKPFPTIDANNFLENDPWKPELLQQLSKLNEIAIIGTGLTAVDLVWELINRDYQGKITLISRRGLLPIRHDLTSSPAIWNGPTSSLATILKHFRQQSEVQQWRAVIDSLRPYSQEIWQALTIKEQRSFLRHLRPYWDVARHRLAPSLAIALENRKQQNLLEIIRGRISKICCNNETHKADIFMISGKKISVEKIINCSGSPSLTKDSTPLIADLFEHDYAQSDPHMIGLLTDNQGRVQNGTNTSQGLFALGPIRRGNLWENIAVPELRHETENLAKIMLEER